MIDRTKRYLAHLSREGEKVMIPATVVAEYLANFPDEEHGQHLAALEENFFIPSLDARCAVIAAQLSRGSGGHRRGEPGARQTHKADCDIIATAIAQKADMIVTGNVAEYERIAGGRIRISDVPEIAEQAEMFEQGAEN